MLPVLAKYNSLMRSENKKDLFKNDIVRSSLNNVDILIADANIRIRIKEMSEFEVIKQVGILLPLIIKDVAIKAEISSYDKTRFFDVIRKYYSELSMSEVKISFDLAMVGELDDFLPKDKTGKADRNHYQAFSTEYYTKILNAYKRKRDRVVGKAYKSLPEPKKEFSENEKKVIHNNFVSSVITAFNKYKNDNEITLFYVPQLVLNLFDVDHFITDEIYNEVVSMSKKKAYSNIMNNKTSLSSVEKISIMKDYENGIINNILSTKSEHQKEYLIVYEIFNQIINNGSTIESNIKKTEIKVNNTKKES